MHNDKPLQVAQFQRKAGPGHFSVERLFTDVRSAMPSDIQITLHVNRFPSTGIFRRIFDACSAWRRRGPVNHILGDVHYLTWLMPRDRTVLTVLDCVSLERLTGLRRWIFWFFWYWWPLKRSARVTVISRFSQESLLRWVRIPEDRIHVIPPTLSPEFQPSPRRSIQGRTRILHIGTYPNKNLPRVVEALADLPVRLMIVGTPDDRICERMKALEIDYEIHSTLSREDLVDLYRSSDIVVFVSTYEGFGLPIIEAQAVGRPVVAGNVCAMPEAAGEAACLVDPFDVGDIRRGICRVLEDPAYAQSLVERGFVNVRRYSPERIAEAYAEVYRLTSRERSSRERRRGDEESGSSD